MQPLHCGWGTAISFKRNLGSKGPYLISCGRTALRLHLFLDRYVSGLYESHRKSADPANINVSELTYAFADERNTALEWSDPEQNSIFNNVGQLGPPWCMIFCFLDRTNPSLQRRLFAPGTCLRLSTRVPHSTLGVFTHQLLRGRQAMLARPACAAGTARIPRCATLSHTHKLPVVTANE